jgi:hypothetical protein
MVTRLGGQRVADGIDPNGVPRVVMIGANTHRPNPARNASSGISSRALERQRIQQAKERLSRVSYRRHTNLVFATTISTPLEPQNVIQ